MWLIPHFYIMIIVTLSIFISCFFINAEKMLMSKTNEIQYFLPLHISQQFHGHLCVRDQDMNHHPLTSQRNMPNIGLYSENSG